MITYLGFQCPWCNTSLIEKVAVASKFDMKSLLQGKVEITIKSHSTSKVSRRTRLFLEFELFIRCHCYSVGVHSCVYGRCGAIFLLLARKYAQTWI